MQFSVNEWEVPSIGADFGTFKLRDTTFFDADAAMNDLVDLLVPFWSDGTSFANWQVFSQPTADDLPVPVIGNVFTGKDGTGTPGTAQEEATQRTNIWRTEDNNLFKLVMLDVFIANFAKISILPGSGILHDLSAYLTASAGWIVGRDGSFPNTFLAQTNDLNDKQRKIRRMT